MSGSFSKGQMVRKWKISKYNEDIDEFLSTAPTLLLKVWIMLVNAQVSLRPGFVAVLCSLTIFVS